MYTVCFEREPMSNSVCFQETCTSMCGTLWEVNNQEEKQFVTSAINQVG